MRYTTLAMLASTMLLVTSGQANPGDAVAGPEPAEIDYELPVLVELNQVSSMFITHQQVVVAEIEVLDVLGVSCVADPANPGQAPCHACVGPGRTNNFPVETQGDGFAVGVPGKPGYYVEVDPIRAVANC